MYSNTEIQIREGKELKVSNTKKNMKGKREKNGTEKGKKI